jgi:hypothetical protein
MPFSEAEQRNKERKNNSSYNPAKGATFRGRPFFMSSIGQFRNAAPSDWLPFLLVLFLKARQENEQ